jgi:hypothetical protein
MSLDVTTGMSEADRILHDALCSVSPADRVLALAAAILDDEASTQAAIISLVAILRVMARRLPAAAERLAISWALLESVEDLNANWN